MLGKILCFAGFHKLGEQDYTKSSFGYVFGHRQTRKRRGISVFKMCERCGQTVKVGEVKKLKNGFHKRARW